MLHVGLKSRYFVLVGDDALAEDGHGAALASLLHDELHLVLAVVENGVLEEDDLEFLVAAPAPPSQEFLFEELPLLRDLLGDAVEGLLLDVPQLLDVLLLLALGEHPHLEHVVDLADCSVVQLVLAVASQIEAFVDVHGYELVVELDLGPLRLLPHVRELELDHFLLIKIYLQYTIRVCLCSSVARKVL